MSSGSRPWKRARNADTASSDASAARPYTSTRLQVERITASRESRLRARAGQCLREPLLRERQRLAHRDRRRLVIQADDDDHRRRHRDGGHERRPGEREDDHREADDREPGGAPSAPAATPAGDEDHDVEDPRDERRPLLRVAGPDTVRRGCGSTGTRSPWPASGSRSRRARLRQPIVSDRSRLGIR